MGIRETINQKKGTVTALAIGLLVLAVAAIAWQTVGSRQSVGALGQAYFSVDDGKSYFAAPATTIPPFEHEGKQAVRAHVFDCGGKAFVGYLERYAPGAKKAKEEQEAQLRAATDPSKSPEEQYRAANAARAASGGAPQGLDSGRELKRPGDKEWVRGSDRAKVSQIEAVKCPDESVVPVEIFP